MLKFAQASHLDHGLTSEHKAFILEAFKDREGFFVATVELPTHLSALTCGLHGPVMGHQPIPDAECSSVTRGARLGPSRVCDRAPVSTRQLTVIAGPHEGEPCILYTAYGGPLAPREPWEPMSPEDQRASVAFWAEHALSR